MRRKQRSQNSNNQLKFNNLMKRLNRQNQRLYSTISLKSNLMFMFIVYAENLHMICKNFLLGKSNKASSNNFQSTNKG